MRTLLLIGYSPARVALPYQLLTIGMNVAVLLLAIIALCLLRSLYMQQLWNVFPQMSDGSIMPAIMLGLLLFAIVSLANALAIRNKIRNVWKN